MAIKDIVKGICEITRCKYDVYTKEKTDELLENKADSINVYAKGDFSVIRTTIVDKGDLTTVEKEVDLPEGFTKDNCVIISAMYSYNADYSVNNLFSDFFNGDTSSSEYVVQINNNLKIKLFPTGMSANEKTVYISIVLMKIS